MKYKQLVYPNLDTDRKRPLYVYIGGKILTDWLGWCLAVVIFSFGAKKGFPTALQAWNADGSKHHDYDLPEGVFVPIWWNGYYHKTYGELGHVAIAKRNGNRVQIWSSPYTHKPNFDYFEGDLKATIDKVTRLYGLNYYLGWTEYCSEVKVAEPIKGEKSNEEICKEIWEGKWSTGRDRENRLTGAGYDYATIQRMIDRGIGKPAPAPDPKKKEEAPNITSPKETPQTGSKEETEPKSNASSAPNSTGETLPPTKTDHHSLAGDDGKTTEHKNDEKPDAGIKDEVMPVVPNKETNKKEFKPMENIKENDILNLVENNDSTISTKTKQIIWWIIDFIGLVGIMAIPTINLTQSPNLNQFGINLQVWCLTLMIYVAGVFKLSKKK